MFIQAIVTILFVLGLIYASWKWIIKPMYQSGDSIVKSELERKIEELETKRDELEALKDEIDITAELNIINMSLDEKYDQLEKLEARG